MSMAEFYVRTAELILAHGQSIVGVVGDTDPFYYTIGRHGRGLPELLIAARIHPDNGTQFLNAINERYGHAAPPHGTRVSFGGTHALIVVDVLAQLDRVQESYTVQVGQFYKTQSYRVQQVLIPDPMGLLPPGCAAPFDRQPFLGDPL